MFLLDTQALTDFVRGDDNPARKFCVTAENQKLEIGASVVSLGALKAEIDQFTDPSERETWEKRFDIALNKFEDRDQLFDVEKRIAIEWSIIKNMPLYTEEDEELGDDERLVVATALIDRLTLVTSFPHRYNLVTDRRGLRIRGL